MEAAKPEPLDPEAATPSSSVVELPWRAFKAFTQLYDLQSGLPPLPGQRLLLLSDSRAGERLRSGLLEKQLITQAIGTPEPYRVLRGVPAGRPAIEGVPDAPLVRPMNRSPQGKAWNYTEGHCAYCGIMLIWFERYMAPTLAHVREDLPPLLSCKSCHATRNGRSLEEMRHLLQMRYFDYQQGVRFSRKQIAWLEKQGFELELPQVSFFFERIASAPAK